MANRPLMVHLIEAEGATPANSLEEPFTSFLADLKELGVRPATRRGESYAIVAARSNPRWWLLPLGNRRAASAGLDLLQPVTLSAEIAKSWTQLMARFGPHSFINWERINLDGRPDVGTDFGGEAENFAYFTGTSGPHRKTAIQIMDRRGGILGYAKLSRRKSVREFIDRESQFLEMIGGLGLASAVTPTLLAKRSSGSYSLLVTDAIRERRSKEAMPFGQKHLNFLQELQSATRREGAEGLLTRVKKHVGSIEASLNTHWVQRFRRALTVLDRKAPQMPISLAHGDFTPWNSFELNSRIYVFDWEYAALDYPLGYDHLHFQLATRLGAPEEKLMDELERELASHWFGGDTTRARSAILFSLIIHATFYFCRSITANDLEVGFESEGYRSRLVDCLLGRM